MWFHKKCTCVRQDNLKLIRVPVSFSLSPRGSCSSLSLSLSRSLGVPVLGLRRFPKVSKKNRGTLLGGPDNEDHGVLGLHWLQSFMATTISLGILPVKIPILAVFRCKVSI